MCGDIEEDAPFENQLYQRFLLAVHVLTEHGSPPRRLRRHDGPVPDRDLHAYMDGLFADTLRVCAADGERTDPMNRYRLLSAQATVFSRLGGFPAGSRRRSIRCAPRSRRRWTATRPRTSRPAPTIITATSITTTTADPAPRRRRPGLPIPSGSSPLDRHGGCAGRRAKRPSRAASAEPRGAGP